MQQTLSYPIESDEPEVGQTVVFSLHGSCQSIYGRIVNKGETESTIVTFAYMKMWLVPNTDMARRVLARSDLYAMIKQYSPPTKQFTKLFETALGSVATMVQP